MRRRAGQITLSLSGRRQEARDHELDAVFSALSDPTRRAMLNRLSEGEASVTELARPFRISLPAVSKHLRILQESGLITREKSGRVHRLQLSPAKLMATLDWMEHYKSLWETQLESLSSYLDREKKEKTR